MDNIFEQEYEKEFVAKCEEIAMYQPTIRYTLDGEWSAEELAEDVQDECFNMNETIHKEYLHRAVLDKNLLKHNILADKIIEDNDLIDRYNEAVAKCDDKVFGIVKFDGWLIKEIDKILKDNLVKGGK